MHQNLSGLFAESKYQQPFDHAPKIIYEASKNRFFNNFFV